MKKIGWGFIICILILTVLVFLLGNNIVKASDTKNATSTKETTTSTYTIFSGLSDSKVIDIAGGSKSNGANVQIYENNNTDAQKFELYKNTDETYTIINKNSGKVLDVQYGNASSGANVWQYEKNDTISQKWILQDAGNGYYYIISKLNSNLYLDVSGGSTSNGANIQIYIKNNSISQKFKLYKNISLESEKVIQDGTYKIISTLNQKMVLDVADGSKKENANIQLYEDNGTDAQKFEIKYNEEGYYTIINKNSNKSMSTELNNTMSGGNVFQGDEVSTDAQKWIIQKNSDSTYTIFSRQSQLCLDVSGGQAYNGNNIWEYFSNGSNSQKFILLPAEEIESKSIINNGEYTIKSSTNEGSVIDVNNESQSSGAYMQMNYFNNSYSQRFEVTYESDGYYTIKNKKSNKVLDIKGGNKKEGTIVQQYEKNNTDSQKWIIRDEENGDYSIISKLNGLYLTIDKSNERLEMQFKNNTANQKFKISEYIYETPVVDAIEDGVYQIVLESNKVFDIAGGRVENNANLQIWGNTKVQQQKFMIKQIGNTGYYEIININSGKLLDVASGGQKIGTNVAQYERNNTDSQKWIIKDDGNRYYKIISKCNNLALDVENGLINNNGTNIQTYFQKNIPAQRFRFEKIGVIYDDTYEIETILAPNRVLDVAGGSKNNGANVQLYYANNSDAQKFILECTNGEYTIKAKHSGKVLTVDKNTNNVYQDENQKLENQKWIIEPAGNGYYNIISKYNGLYLDVHNANTGNGTNIKVFKANGGTAQKFKFFKGFRTFFEEGTYGSSGLKVSGDGRGTDLKYYKFGKGNNVLFATFSIHGFEDSYSHDGSELTYIADQFKNHLANTTDANIINNWTIYILPNLNPDGQAYGWTNNGPGRTTLYSSAQGNQGIDMNRNWQTGSSYTRYYDARNYNGTEAYQAYETRALRDFLLSHKSVTGQTLLVDLHGWLNETIGDSGLGSYYRNYYGMSTHISSYGTGYLVNWARQSLGNSNRTARSVLVELPQVYSHQEILNRDFAGKYINATLTMLRENG